VLLRFDNVVGWMGWWCCGDAVVICGGGVVMLW
jgi:hypothetical protein